MKRTSWFDTWGSGLGDEYPGPFSATLLPSAAERDRIAAQLGQPPIAADTKRHHLDADVAHYQMDMWYFLQLSARMHHDDDPAVLALTATAIDG